MEVMDTRIILASKSRARYELLKSLGFDIEVVEPHAKERKAKSPKEVISVVVDNSYRKALSVKTESIVVAADTLVFDDNIVFGKPSSIEEAREMILYLNGRWHNVVSGLSIVFPDGDVISLYDIARVKFKVLTQEEIEFYVLTKEPLGKAGGYGLQGLGVFLVEKIYGHPSTIIGLPIHRLIEALSEKGYWPPREPKS